MNRCLFIVIDAYFGCLLNMHKTRLIFYLNCILRRIWEFENRGNDIELSQLFESNEDCR